MPCNGPFNDKSDMKYKRWKSFKDNLREMIKHENDLTNHRITWLCAIQGFLFLALGTILNGLFVFMASKDISQTDSGFNLKLGDVEIVILGVVVSVIILCSIGISVAYYSWKGLLGSTNAIKRLVNIACRKERNICIRDINDFREPVIGGCSYDQKKEAEKSLFNWNKISDTDNKQDADNKPDADNKKLKEFLIKKYRLNWIGNATIKKSDNKTIKVTSKKDETKTISLKLNNELSEVVLEIGNKKSDTLLVKKEYKHWYKPWNKHWNIYRKDFIPFFPWIMIPKIFVVAWSAIALFFVYIPANFFSSSTWLPIILIVVWTVILLYFAYKFSRGIE